jgi:cell division transport system permease protein
MAMSLKLGYFLGQALTSFRRNWVQSIAAITTVGLCLVVLGIILVSLAVGRQLISQIEQQVEIEIFIKDAARTRDIQNFQDKLVSWSEIRKVDYISKEKALAQFKKDFKDKPDVLENIQGNPLPASFRIWLNDPKKQVKLVANRIKNLDDINLLVADKQEDIQYGQKYVGRLFSFTSKLSMASGIFAALLVFVSLVLITNTIRLAIYARRKEIGVMMLVGASNWFIRWPFLIEGMIQGILGAILAVAILTGIYKLFFQTLISGRLLTFVKIPFNQLTFIRLMILLTLSGMLIGALGSVVALRRYLKKL